MSLHANIGGYDFISYPQGDDRYPQFFLTPNLQTAQGQVPLYVHKTRDEATRHIPVISDESFAHLQNSYDLLKGKESPHRNIERIDSHIANLENKTKAVQMGLAILVASIAASFFIAYALPVGLVLAIAALSIRHIYIKRQILQEQVALLDNSRALTGASQRIMLNPELAHARNFFIQGNSIKVPMEVLEAFSKKK